MLDRIGHGQLVADRGQALGGEAPAQLEREQRVPQRGVDDPAQQLARQAQLEPLGQHPARRAEAERPHLQPLQRRQRALDGSCPAGTPGEHERHVAAVRDAGPRRRAHRRRARPATGGRRRRPATGPRPRAREARSGIRTRSRRGRAVLRSVSRAGAPLPVRRAGAPAASPGAEGRPRRAGRSGRQKTTAPLPRWPVSTRPASRARARRRAQPPTASSSRSRARP